MNFIKKGFLSWKTALEITRRFLSTCEKSEPPPSPPPPKMKTFQIYRYNPDERSPPKMQSYTIDINEYRTFKHSLKTVLKIKITQDSTLAFRRSCREGICGSCAMNIDGVNRLACLYKFKPSGTTKIYPLPHMYVMKDLVVDMDRFLNQHNRIRPYLIRKSNTEAGKEQQLQSMKDRDLLDGYVECILCACCSTSCPAYWWHGHGPCPNDFLGPSALLNAYRWVVDSRDEATSDRLCDLKNFWSIYRCHQIHNCSNCCPKRLQPGKAIAKLKLLLAGLNSKKKPDISGSVPALPEKACDQGGNKCGKRK